MIHTSVCMITYNKLPFLKRSLPAIIESIDPSKEVELLVLNNGSDDGTEDYLRAVAHIMPDNVRYRSFNSRWNIGLNAYSIVTSAASGNIIVTADDDIFEIIPDGWEGRFEKVLHGTFGGRRFGYVSTDTINDDGGRMPDSAIGLAKNGDIEIEVGPAGGWFAATTKEIMNKVGGFHIDKPAMYLEDADYQRRVWNEGYLVGTLLNTKVFHARAPRFYKELGVENTYREKERLAKEVGIILEPLA